ncbi:MAG: bifunctional methylenetetrahydrofolate dehydrogenase/methenyltetrahydrofolate cyclohydrolase FolD [Pyrinomonadaceae bacterium]
MTAKILSGKQIADDIKAEVKSRVGKLSFKPCLSVIRVGEDPASAVYVGSKVKTVEALGMRSEHHHLPDTIDQGALLDLVRKLNADPDIDGVLIQLPLPKHIDETAIIEAVDPEKDVDGFHPINVGRLSHGEESLVPCTPAGVIEMLKRSGIQIAGKNAVIVGRSNIVGKPMAMLLLRENATVTICHSRTVDLPAITRRADILIAAIGRPGFIRSEHIGENAVVVDVGINSVADRSILSDFFEGEKLERRIATVEKRGSTLVGDVSTKDAMARAAYLTPVPGGVGLLTVAMLMNNTLDAAVRRRTKNT